MLRDYQFHHIRIKTGYIRVHGHGVLASSSAPVSLMFVRILPKTRLVSLSPPQQRVSMTSVTHKHDGVLAHHHDPGNVRICKCSRIVPGSLG
jgi:hypothetical protein